MPTLNGPETTILIREFFYSKGMEQPIITAVTGHSDQKTIDISIHSGMNESGFDEASSN